MPTYVYKRRRDGKRVELTMSMAKQGRRERKDGSIKLNDGSLADRVWSVDTTPKTSAPSCWPLISNAAGCHPDQIPEMKSALKAKGAACDFTPGGEAIFESRGHRKRVCEAMGVIDNNAGYGDASPR